MLASYMQCMHNNNLEIRIAGSSCSPQKLFKLKSRMKQFADLQGFIRVEWNWPIACLERKGDLKLQKIVMEACPLTPLY